MSERCKQVEERRVCRETINLCFEESRVLFHINSKALPSLEAFPYLGRMITYNNRDWPTVYQNLKKAQRRWGMIARVLAKTGATVQARGMIYKAMDQ